LKIVHESYLKDNNNVEALARKVQSCGHLLASVHEQGFAVCNKSNNIDAGESKFLFEKCFLFLILKLNLNNILACFSLMVNLESFLSTIFSKSIPFSPSEIASEIKNFGLCTSQFFETLYTSSKSEQVNSQVDDLKEKLLKITNMIGNLSNNNDDIDQLGDLVEKELSGMDKAIEEVR
jgi:hypothetical protein